MVVHEPRREVPVIADVDVCVIGGSATGVFAAVRAARLGASVALVEMANCFGGTATLSMVNHWHRIHAVDGTTQIIGGLSVEVIDELVRRGAAVLDVNERTHIEYNTEVMKLVLDDLVADEAGVEPFFHSRFSSVLMDGDSISAALLETKSGRVAIRAKNYVDASGDGDLAAAAGVPFRKPTSIMPGTTCAKIEGMPPRDIWNLTEQLRRHGPEFGIQKDKGWYGFVPDASNVSLHFDLHVFDMDPTDVRSLTAAEMRGRRNVAQVMEFIRAYAPLETSISLIDLPSRVGIRESRHFECLYRLTGDDLLEGRAFEDGIANGTYPPDLHDPEDGSTHLKFLDGRELRSSFTAEHIWSRWKPEGEPFAPFYRIPYRSLVPRGVRNLLIAGRSIDADPWAFGGTRVMINCNQMGEAAGVASALASRVGSAVQEIDVAALQSTMRDGGSILPAP